MGKTLKTKPLKDELDKEIAIRVEAISKNNRVPKLVTLRVGSSPDDISYENSLIKKCHNYKINIDNIVLDEKISTDELIKEIEKYNIDDNIDGLMLFRPLPKHIDEEKVIWEIDYKKDLDSSNPINLAKLMLNDKNSYKPATPFAVMEILKHFNINLEGANIVILNRSEVFGKPMMMMLLEENATVTICHSRTKNIEKICKNADIIISATGKAKSINENYINPESIVIDVGVSLDNDGNLSGDADFENINEKVKMITPRKQGVGLITSTLLIKQLIDKLYYKKA